MTSSRCRSASSASDENDSNHWLWLKKEELLIRFNHTGQIRLQIEGSKLRLSCRRLNRCCVSTGLLFQTTSFRKNTFKVCNTFNLHRLSSALHLNVVKAKNYHHRFWVVVAKFLTWNFKFFFLSSEAQSYRSSKILCQKDKLLDQLDQCYLVS